MRNWIHIILATLCLIAAVSLAVAYRAAQGDTAKLHQELQSTQQALTAATTRQQARDADLKKTLAALQRQKSTIHTPADALKALPTVLPLPTPLTLDATANPSPTDAKRPSANKPAAPAPQTIHLPAEDLKPLYDFALDCKACQAQLAAAQSDLRDEKSKTSAITKERNDALRVARGGSVLRRVARAAKWFAIGAVLGAAASKLSH